MKDASPKNKGTHELRELKKNNCSNFVQDFCHLPYHLAKSLNRKMKGADFNMQ